jgi:peptide/nickel transport system permease protein
VRRYLAGRALQALAVAFIVATASFFLIHAAPGDPFSAQDPRISPTVRAQLMQQFGLDRPLPEQYVRYLGSAARGDLGWSFSQHRPVRAVLAETIPRTLLLMGLSLGVSLLLGIVLGAWQGARHGSRGERAVGTLSLVTYSLPDFWLALLVLLVFAHWIPLLPAGGMVDPVMHEYMSSGAQLADRARHLVLPVLTLALLRTAAFARYQRAALLDVVELDFVRTARAKGLGERAVIYRHALRNALIPTLTIIGFLLPAMFGGAVFVERIFAWPGMGDAVVTAIASRDYPLVTGGVVIAGIMVAAGSLVADLLLAALDPRVRLR